MFGNKYKNRYEDLVNYLLAWKNILIDDIIAYNDGHHDGIVQTCKDELFIVQSCLHKVNELNKDYK